jgi:hypothetical protein
MIKNSQRKKQRTDPSHWSNLQMLINTVSATLGVSATMMEALPGVENEIATIAAKWLHHQLPQFGGLSPALIAEVMADLFSRDCVPAKYSHSIRDKMFAENERDKEQAKQNQGVK